MRQAMPPRSSLTSSFSASTDANDEVVCPLTNPDGSHCRKRCLGVSAASRSRSRSCSCSCSCRAMPCDACRAVGMQASCEKSGVTNGLHQTGEALSVDARTHSKSASGALYPQASSHRGKLPAHDQHPSFRAASSPATAKLWIFMCVDNLDARLTGLRTDQWQYMATTDTSTLLPTPVRRRRPGRWRRCTLPPARLRLWRSYTTT